MLGAGLMPMPWKITGYLCSLAGTADSHYIRAETCLFMVKLTAQYSSVEIMNEKLCYAINCWEDPLSG